MVSPAEMMVEISMAAFHRAPVNCVIYMQSSEWVLFECGVVLYTMPLLLPAF